MPLDINLFRADKGGDPDRIRESQRRRFASVEIVDEIIAKDNEWRQLTGDIDNLKKERNATQKQVGIKMKAGEEVKILPFIFLFSHFVLYLFSFFLSFSLCLSLDMIVQCHGSTNKRDQ
jgi:hypothetical protein